MASLIYDAEKSLKEILGIKNVIILVIDHDLDMFIKLNHELIVTEQTESDEKSSNSNVFLQSRQFNPVGDHKFSEGHL
jgi:ABC-type microcin C transport system duplicated ATPase subunit YejF